MSKPLPKWAMIRYAHLWRKFSDKPFTHKHAADLLKEPQDTTLSLVIQELKRSGWVEISLDPNDSRIRLYTLKEPNTAVKEMIK